MDKTTCTLVAVVLSLTMTESSYLVPAAHCLKKRAEDIKVRSGSSRSDEGGVFTNVARIILHEMYEVRRPHHDIGLIELSDPLEFGPGTAPISLANQDEPIFEGELVQVTGWGYTTNTGSSSDILLGAIIPIHDQEKCQEIYGDENMFCAGGIGVQMGACKGDSGGPAVLNGILVGLVKGGKGNCTKPEYPGSFTRIAAYREWIDRYARCLD